jgi:hypothetical protein
MIFDFHHKSEISQEDSRCHAVVAAVNCQGLANRPQQR